MDIISGFAEIDTTRLYFETAGRGFPLVFIHGRGGDMRDWDEQFYPFARQYRAVRYDLRGSGMSDQPSGLFSHTKDLLSLLNYLQIDTAFLVGIGFGTAAAMDLAIENPERVAGLAAANPVLNGYSYENLNGSIETLPREHRANPPIHLVRCPVIAITGEDHLAGIDGSIQMMKSALPLMHVARLTGASIQPQASRPVQFNRVVLTFFEWIQQKEHFPISFPAGYPFHANHSLLG